MERWYKYIVIHHTATRCMSAEEMKLSMQRTWVQNRSWTHIPTHYIVWCSWDIVQVNSIDKIVWATLNNDANANWIHIEVVWDFNSEMVPSKAQYTAVNQIIKRIDEKKQNLAIVKHWDFQRKNCPWKNFDIWKLSNYRPIPHANGAKRPVPAVKWTTVEERASSFISQFWYDYKSFKTIWEASSIKPEVLLCIARAEGFGKDSWSENNIMNAWNNDRWDRISFTDWRDSVKLAASKILKWLLKNKQTIWDLSYAWNCKIDCQYIYASSKWPREINVRNCLWKIYNTNVWADFTFRK